MARRIPICTCGHPKRMHEWHKPEGEPRQQLCLSCKCDDFKLARYQEEAV